MSGGRRNAAAGLAHPRAARAPQAHHQRKRQHPAQRHPELDSAFHFSEQILNTKSIIAARSLLAIWQLRKRIEICQYIVILQHFQILDHSEISLRCLRLFVRAVPLPARAQECAKKSTQRKRPASSLPAQTSELASAIPTHFADRLRRQSRSQTRVKCR